MLCGQGIKVFTDHKNLIQDTLGLTSDRVSQWRLLLEEFGPKIVHIKGIHNTVADVISCLDFGAVQDENARLDIHEVLVSLHHACSYRREHLHSPTPNKHGVCQSQQRRCDLLINSKGHCTSPEGRCSPEETKQYRHVFYSIGREYSSPLQAWQNCHPQSSSEPSSYLVPPLPAASWKHMS